MSLQPLFPLWAILLGSLLVFAGLAWLEIRRSTRWLPFRIGALFLVLLAINGLMLHPLLEQVQEEKPILLLTKDFDEKLVDSLRNLRPKWQIYRTPEADVFPNSIPLDDLLTLTELDHRIGAIAGEGLPAYALEYLAEKHFQFFPATPKQGIGELQNKSYTEGQLNAIEGTYLVETPSIHLVLNGPAGPVDSMVLKERGEQDFALGFTPRSPGKWQYQLVEKDSTGQVLSQENLPIVVKPQKQLRVLMLQAFPTFEIRSLKDFLVDRGHAVAVRTQISRSNTQTEFANIPDQNLNRLTNALLDNFDLLITDASAFDLITQSELHTLTTAIEEGLGFLGMVNGNNYGFQRWLNLSHIATEPDTTDLDNGLTLPTYSVQRRENREWYELQQTRNAQPTAAYFYQGRGKIGFQATQESYAYLLRGDSLAYASLWLPVLEGCLREEYPEYTIELMSDFPNYIGEPIDFRVTANQSPETVFFDDQEIPLQEDPYLDEVWYGRSWLSEPGWHRLEVGEESLDVYAFLQEAWPGLKRSKKQQQSIIHAQTDRPLQLADQKKVVQEPISRFWFYLLFLLGAGFLWLAPKL